MESASVLETRIRAKTGDKENRARQSSGPFWSFCETVCQRSRSSPIQLVRSPRSTEHGQRCPYSLPRRFPERPSPVWGQAHVREDGASAVGRLTSVWTTCRLFFRRRSWWPMPTVMRHQGAWDSKHALVHGLGLVWLPLLLLPIACANQYLLRTVKRSRGCCKRWDRA